MKNSLLTTRALALCAFLSLSLMSCDWKKPSAQASVVSLAGNAAGSNETVAETAAEPATAKTATAASADNTALPVPAAGSAASIMARPQIPILCYHQIRDYRPADSRSAKDYIIPPADFRAQMKGLADSGYTTILPAQLYEYLVTGKPLPPKPVMLTFDDGCDEQFEFAHNVLDPLKFKGAYFIMTVSVNRPNYMKAEQIRQLADEGHAIGLHTWDHHNVKQYQGTDWQKQIEQPKVTLEKITGRPIQFFAYPFGLWNPQAIPQLKDRGLMAAFQLSTARDASDPLYTIRRIIVPGGWSGAQLVNRMKNSFH